MERRLRCLSSKTDYELFQSGSKTFTIGRQQKNDIVLCNLRISNIHCSFVLTPELEVVLKSLSSNGTWLNYIVVEKGGTRILHNGDTVTLPGAPRKKPIDFVYKEITYSFPDTSVWSKYEKEELLGKGTFGSVYKCRQRTTGLAFAIKNIDCNRFELVSSVGEMIQREITVMKALRSDNEHIVQFKESFEDNSMIHLVLEYVAGGNLGQHLKQFAPICERNAKSFLLQICQGVAFIHAQGVAHRDLKPENILLTAEDPPKLKIADFGLAKLSNHASLLETKCGTPNYLAPEVLQQHYTVYNNLVDSWSVGIITVVMLTNKLPYIWSNKCSAKGRQMDWSTLREIEVKYTVNCATFIERLVQEDPRVRMSIEEALIHSWFTSESDGGITPALGGNPPMQAVQPTLNPPTLAVQRLKQTNGDSTVLLPGGLAKAVLKQG